MTSKSALRLQWEAVLCRQWTRNSFCYCFSYSISIAVLFLVLDHRLKHHYQFWRLIWSALKLSCIWALGEMPIVPFQILWMSTLACPEENLGSKISLVRWHKSGPLITSHLHRSGCRLQHHWAGFWLGSLEVYKWSLYKSELSVLITYFSGYLCSWIVSCPFFWVVCPLLNIQNLTNRNTSCALLTCQNRKQFNITALSLVNMKIWKWTSNPEKDSRDHLANLNFWDFACICVMW